MPSKENMAQTPLTTWCCEGGTGGTLPYDGEREPIVARRENLSEETQLH